MSGSNDTVGGSARGAGNLISANPVGVLFDSGAGSGDAVLGNRIGTDVSGSLPLGNMSDGIQFRGGSPIDVVGGTAAGDSNTIAFNGGAGVGVLANPFGGTSPSGITVSGNSIHDNAGPGIDLGDDGVTPNTPGGPHAGPNLLQNFPVLAAAVTHNGRTTVKGSINAASNALITVQF